jgi:hypothetical protein
MALGDLRERTPVLFSCTLDQAEGPGRSAGAERVEGGHKEAAASPGGTRIGRRCSQTCGDPTRNSIGLRWFLRGKEKGGKEGMLGPFIGGLAW